MWLMETINITIDGRKIQVEHGLTVLEAAQKAGIYIPTLCYLKEINKIGACRVCLVEIKGTRGLQASCVYPVSEGLEVFTNSSMVRETRKAVVELLISNHPQDCLKCSRSQNCELQDLAKQLGISEIRFKGAISSHPPDLSSRAIERNPDKCVLCRRCVAVCGKVQDVHILSAMNRGFETLVTTAFNHPLDNINCTLCGQCINVCPVEAIKEKDHIEKVWEALANESLHVVVQTAPAVRAVLGEEFGLPIGTSVTGKMVTALKMLGFNKVFDTDFTADLTIIEEGHELLERLETNKNLPLITSCSPGWIKYCEHHYPELIDNLSTCKSPQQMFGALIKTYYAEKENIDGEKIFSVSIMPCTAKKYEADRPEMNSSGFQDVDAVLTVRELARMIKQAGIDFNNLPDSEFDLPMGMSTGAGLIFGATGGVMEAALRTVYEVVTKENLDKLDFEEVRGLEGIKEAVVNLKGTEVRVAVANGLVNAKKLMEKIKSGQSDYHFVEVMACQGGCIGGGGTPIVKGLTRSKLAKDYKELRISAIYGEEKEIPLRKSHENPAVKKLYQDYLIKPLSEKSHQLLHTHYHGRNKYFECNEK